MSDSRNTLQALFTEGNRFPNFGEVLTNLNVRGFRCHSNTIIDIQSPVTALCGLNGTGKSTILQSAAVAYAPNDGLPYYIKDFLVVSALDPSPFAEDASLRFGYWQASQSSRFLTLSRRAATKRWQGYRGRPTRSVFFAGVGLYLPRVEQRRDFIVTNARRLRISGSTPVGDRAKSWICRVLEQGYGEIISHTVEVSTRSSQVTAVDRAGTRYSEAHMGFGEGRTQHLINRLESLPERSLVLIEEPETSLHPAAQAELGRYLVDVCIVKRHQVLLTTHSEFLLHALPSASRVYLHRTPSGIEPICGLTALQAKSLMTGGETKSIHVLVEDRCAQIVLTEILRRIDPTLLAAIGIHSVGDAETIAKTVRALRSTGLPVAAVRDGDQPAIPSENIFKLPGGSPPEMELFSSNAVAGHLRTRYSLDVAGFRATLNGSDHHEWPRRLAARLTKNEDALLNELAEVYARSLPEAECSTLFTLLKEASRR